MRKEIMSSTYTKTTITLEAALRAVDQGLKKAEAIGVPVAIVVADAAGEVKVQVTQDGAGSMSVIAAKNKAYTSAMSRATTANFRDFITSDQALADTIPRLPGMLALGGGVPIMLDGVLVGAIGVSGGHYSQDTEVAEAALAAIA
jgi:uncharacterized protein GlcG (DUF336 family)